MATTDFIAAIELGSSKIAGIAGKKNSDGSIQVLAYAREDSSSFIRKGVIYNLDKTAQSLTSIINKLEGALNNSIAKIYVGIGGQSLRTVRNVVSRDLEEETIISQELVDSICDENLEIPLIDMDILDVAPQEYKIGNNLQADPVGVAGSHIEGRFLNIVARASLKKNLERCFEQAKIEIADLLISPLVTADAVLTESERRSGCALIDFGADTSTISIYKNNILRFLTVLPLGGNSITHDLVSLQMEEEEAERLKIRYGNAFYEEEEGEEGEEPATCQLEDGNRTIELGKLNNIIEARTEEIIANVWNQIQLSGYDDKLLAGLIITGGAANLKDLDEVLRKRSKIEKVRNARFVRNTIHADEDVVKKDGTQNTLFGLLIAGNENCCLLETPAPQPHIQPQPQPEPVNMFEEDESLKEQEAAARAAKKKKEEEEKKRKEEEKQRKLEEKKRREEERRNKPNWFKSTFDKLSNEIFSDEDMK
ncbi:cell division protein FtsA [Bacteroides fragilis]